LARGVLATLRRRRGCSAHKQKTSIIMEAQRVDIRNRTGNRSFDLLGCRPEARLARLRRGLSGPLMRPKIAHHVSARPGALLSC
jgi:hypothetical protein